MVLVNDYNAQNLLMMQGSATIDFEDKDGELERESAVFKFNHRMSIVKLKITQLNSNKYNEQNVILRFH